MGLFIPGGLINANSEVSIQAYAITQGADGGTVETYSTTVATAVPVLITGLGGDRDKTFGTDAQNNTGLLSGTDSSLNRTDVRLLVTTAPTDRPEMSGWYLRIKSPAGHPSGQYGLVGQRISVTWEKLELPIS